MPWQTLPASQRRALLQKSLATRRSRILDLAATVGPVIESYRAQGYGFRRIAALLNLSDHRPLRGETWHPTTVVRVWRTYTTQPVQLKLTKPLPSSGASRTAGIDTPSPAARPGAGEAGGQDGLLRNDTEGGASKTPRPMTRRSPLASGARSSSVPMRACCRRKRSARGIWRKRWTANWTGTAGACSSRAVRTRWPTARDRSAAMPR